MAPQPFRIEIPQAALDDVAQRLERARLPHDYANEDWSYGTPTSYLRELVDYWRDEYDWRTQEKAINRFDHYRVEVDGLPIHFIRAPGKGLAPRPLILSHGWPWTFWDMHEVIGPLSDPAAHGGDPADAFDVIVPSMPGFGFSTPLTRTGINFWSTADLWHELMTGVLGYERYFAAGGDWGALTTSQLGHKFAASVDAIHISTVAPLSLFGHERPWDVTGGMLAPDGLSEDEREAFLAWQRRIASHVCVQVLDPQTLSFGMHDSPAALLGWLVERRRTWGDAREGLDKAFGRDFLITTAMIYWLTESFVTSARFYAEAARHPWVPSHDRAPVIEAPTGISRFTHDGTTGLGAGLESQFNLVLDRTHNVGGHFAHVEAPEAVVADIRETMRPYR
ncbi:epoxide hydrolase [Novosphingobium marinum]|uniref:Microsomal epoxide hydrolase n=1 Tax=Novosphingobium marinum TaxID=1514948 RepID=A0A7Y9XWR5_9SPHN|nr:epoxide hydrolase family protein [Novosphingobium marinum]NYH94501.1 microsomal epoxide hydrolase [Novosphingobium marinum]GGC22807.1 epoxide hydrolase [Novosphingobium marinum]